MSIEKLSDDSRIEQEPIPFTQIRNTVIENIKDGDSFLVWCYLQSKSSNWKVVKENIKKKFGYGDSKLKRIFSYLNRSNLIKYVQRTDSKGQFEQMDTLVLNGKYFDKNQPFIEKRTGGLENRPAVNRTCGFGGLLNKEIQKKEKITKQREEKPKMKTEVFTLSDNNETDYKPDDDDLELGATHNINLHHTFEKFMVNLKKKRKKKFVRQDWKLWLMREIHHKNQIGKNQ